MNRDAPPGYRLRVAWVRSLVVVSVVALTTGVALTAWSVYGAWPVPEGYEFPRHSIWGGGPAALFEGTLVEEDGCIVTDSGGTVVWPPGSWLSVDDGEPIVHVSWRAVRMGELVRLGGGVYSRAELAGVAGGAAVTRCPEPFFLTTGLAD